VTADDRSRLVLVVDDAEDIRMLWAEVLGAAGYRVLEASDGEAAVELAVAHRPRVVLMDMAMPNVDGWEATRRIRQLADEREIAIVAVSAMSEVDGRAAAFRSGCDGFIEKPTTPDVILEVVRSFTETPA
jgi:two-component system, cell cycle response regulator DivK